MFVSFLFQVWYFLSVKNTTDGNSYNNNSINNNTNKYQQQHHHLYTFSSSTIAQNIRLYYEWIGLDQNRQFDVMNI